VAALADCDEAIAGARRRLQQRSVAKRRHLRRRVEHVDEARRTPRAIAHGTRGER
jgi:hypothetical protein